MMGAGVGSGKKKKFHARQTYQDNTETKVKNEFVKKELKSLRSYCF